MCVCVCVGVGGGGGCYKDTYTQLCYFYAQVIIFILRIVCTKLCQKERETGGGGGGGQKERITRRNKNAPDNAVCQLILR